MREKEEFPILIFRYEILVIIIVGNVKLVPIVKPRALKLRDVNLKAQRTNEVKGSSCCGARACNVSGILRYLGLVQDYVYLSFLFHIRILDSYL